jgi:FkbM family methyltransferase
MQMLDIRFPGIGKFPFVIHSNNDKHISARISRKGAWEPFLSEILLQHLAKGSSLIDVGANIGWYTALGGIRVGPEGHVLAFEPDLVNGALLKHNVQLNNLENVSVFDCGLSSNKGVANLLKSMDNLGDHRLVPDASSESVEIKIETLDSILDRRPHLLKAIKVLKVDVQGAEYAVFLGARKTLNSPDVDMAIFVEFSPNLLRIHDRDEPDKLIELLEGLGRNMYIISSRWRTAARCDSNQLRAYASSVEGQNSDAGIDLVIANRADGIMPKFVKFYHSLVL